MTTHLHGLECIARGCAIPGVDGKVVAPPEGLEFAPRPIVLGGSLPPPPDVAPYLRLYKHAGMWVTELWLGDVGSRRSSAYDEFKGTYVGSDTAADALTRGLEMLEAQTTKENRT